VKHSQIRLEQRKEAFHSILVHVYTRILLLRVVNELMHVAFQGPVATGGVRIQSIARLHGEVSGLLHRLHGAIAGRLNNDSPPGD
jgi:hypothetical protein